MFSLISSAYTDLSPVLTSVLRGPFILPNVFLLIRSTYSFLLRIFIFILVNVLIVIVCISIASKAYRAIRSCTPWVKHCADVEKYNNVVETYSKLYNIVLETKTVIDYNKLVEYCKSVSIPTGVILDDVVLHMDLQKLPNLRLCSNKLCTDNVPEAYKHIFSTDSYNRLINYKSFDTMCAGCLLSVGFWIILFVICLASVVFPICVLIYS